MVPYPPWVGAIPWYQHPKNPHSGWSQDGTFVGTGPGWGFGDPHPIFAPTQLRFCPQTTTTALVPGDARVFGDAAKKQGTLGRLWGQGSPGGASGCRALVLTLQGPCRDLAAQGFRGAHREAAAGARGAPMGAGPAPAPGAHPRRTPNLATPIWGAGTVLKAGCPPPNPTKQTLGWVERVFWGIPGAWWRSGPSSVPPHPRGSPGNTKPH